MIETILTFSLALALILLAQWGEQRRWAQWLSYLTLLASGLLLLAAGAAMAVQPGIVQEFSPEANGAGFAWALAVTGLIIILPVAAAMISAARGKDPTLRGVPWTHPVHLTAWTLLALFIGSNFAMTSLESLAELEIDDPLTLILSQNAAFALAALLGVGWGVRRNWRQTIRRLGLSRPTMGNFLTGAGMALAMLMSTAIVGALVALIFGEDMTASTGFNEQIISQLPGVAGVILMGLATGVGEEMLYRGALQPVAGVWITSFLFAISHIQYLSPAIIVIFVLGLLLGYTRNKWGLTTAIWSHAVYNSLVGLLALLAMNFDQLTPGM
jgi:membrane protease YdiL (CAAX protease family)